MTRPGFRRASVAAAIIAVPQAALGIRVLWRLLRTGMRAAVIPESGCAGNARVAVIVPVLNETDRLSPCLEGLTAQDSEVVTDPGSRWWFGRWDAGTGSHLHVMRLPHPAH